MTAPSRASSGTGSKGIHVMKLSRIVVVTVAVFLSCGISAKAEDLGVVKSDLEAGQSEIQTAQTEDARYTGGLVKALIGVKLRTLRKTEAQPTARNLSLKLRQTGKY